MASWWLVWLAALTSARAESFYLESEPLATREAAEAVVGAAAEEGCEGQVVRRYVRGHGWRYLYRSEGLAEADVVRGCMERLALPEVPLKLVERNGPRTRVLVLGTPATEREASSPDAQRWTASEVLKRLLRAHAGASDGPDGADRVLFRYERRTGDGLRVLHTYARRLDDVYLEVEVLEGEGVSSKAGLSAGRGWLAGSRDAFDAEHVREQLARFSPAAVLRTTVDLAAGRLDLPEADLLHVAGQHQDEGQHVVELSFEGARLEPPLRLVVDTASWRLVELERGAPGAAVRWRFTGWREMEDGALRPERIRVWRNGQLLDELTVHELELSPTLPEEWFAPPNG